MNTEVSPCCGEQYEEVTLTDCCDVCFMEGTDECSKCKTEAGAEEGYVCNRCSVWFESTEEEIDYDQRVIENLMEEKAEAKRKYGE